MKDSQYAFSAQWLPLPSRVNPSSRVLPVSPSSTSSVVPVKPYHLLILQSSQPDLLKALLFLPHVSPSGENVLSSLFPLELSLLPNLAPLLTLPRHLSLASLAEHALCLLRIKQYSQRHTDIHMYTYMETETYTDMLDTDRSLGKKGSCSLRRGRQPYSCGASPVSLQAAAKAGRRAGTGDAAGWYLCLPASPLHRQWILSVSRQSKAASKALCRCNKITGSC